MQDTMKINDEVVVGPQPTAEEIRELSQQGFKSVINFREDDEKDQPISPFHEGAKVKAVNMDYLHLPVSESSMAPELVDQFREKYSKLPKPVFAHCKSGKRSGAMVMMHIAVENNMTGEQTLDKAKEMGFECDQPELVEFVKSYVNEHNNA